MDDQDKRIEWIEKSLTGKILRAQSTGDKYDVNIILNEIMKEVSEMYCPNSYGFEGAETFSDCGNCVVCESRKYIKILNQG